MTDSKSAVPLAVLSGLTLLVTGCAQQGGTRYPSLLPRAIESRGDAEVTPAPLAVDPDPALDKQIADITGVVDSAQRDFTIAATKAETLANAAKGAAVGSERWIDAQSALAELDVFRATTSSALTDLEQAAIARAADSKPDYPALVTARDAAQTALDAQSTTISRLQNSLPSA